MQLIQNVKVNNGKTLIGSVCFAVGFDGFFEHGYIIGGGIKLELGGKVAREINKHLFLEMKNGTHCLGINK